MTLAIIAAVSSEEYAGRIIGAAIGWALVIGAAVLIVKRFRRGKP